ncbi:MULTISPECIES: cupredoxin domain-containing protein [Pseudomonas]|uniref:Cupredoxin family protein n=1 Tax=Pseudomonas spirodelae TaxID=3101751 RepID=A0ABU5P4P8_9PSED|nr:MULTISPECIES: cupredoxin family protein [unclassified Pseudomonas]MBU0900914.1 cupredoxin family protein [Gammaproteobacteria bacterium]MDD2161252.1 cupredoxin family protein [Pseudomonas sp. MIL19]MEA1604616.1 cupredoxin family protein [Pseudomonas sp. T5W1]
MQQIKPLSLALALIGLLASGAVLAHSDQHAMQHSMMVVKEQKPWGIAGDREQVTRTIKIGMSDQMRFSPDQLQIKQGETIRFVHRNEGQLMHEFVLGTQADLDAHAAMMAKFPGMQHDEPYMAHVGPGQGGEIIWTFNRAGEFDFACLIAGHYQAGMVGKIRVLAE